MIAPSSDARLHTQSSPFATVCLALVVAVAGCGCEEPAPAPARPKPAKAPTPDEGYLETLVRAKKTAETTVAKTHLRAVWTSLHMHAITHGGTFPAALADLNNPSLLKAPGKAGQAYQYIPNQKPATGRAKDNILVYEPNPTHRGRTCLVLKADGTVGLLAPEKLQQAVAETKRRLSR